MSTFHSFDFIYCFFNIICCRKSVYKCICSFCEVSEVFAKINNTNIGNCNVKVTECIAEFNENDIRIRIDSCDIFKNTYIADEVSHVRINSMLNEHVDKSFNFGICNIFKLFFKNFFKLCIKFFCRSCHFFSECFFKECVLCIHICIILEFPTAEFHTEIRIKVIHEVLRNKCSEVVVSKSNGNNVSFFNTLLIKFSNAFDRFRIRPFKRKFTNFCCVI